MSRNEIAGSNLPKKALSQISKRQQSYLDEFRFFAIKGCKVEAWYAGELLAVWDGKKWVS